MNDIHPSAFLWPDDHVLHLKHTIGAFITDGTHLKGIYGTLSLRWSILALVGSVMVPFAPQTTAITYCFTDIANTVII